MTDEKVALQREVVRNERRQSYENRPYGMAQPFSTARGAMTKAMTILKAIKDFLTSSNGAGTVAET